MTRVRAKALLPVIQAWSEGKQIQCRTRNSVNFWNDYNGVDPDFWNEALEWRVNPEPRDFIIHKPIDSCPTSGQLALLIIATLSVMIGIDLLGESYFAGICGIGSGLVFVLLAITHK